MGPAMTISDIASLATAAAVVIAVVFGVLQLRHLAKSRAIFSSAELVHALRTPEFTRSIGIIAQLPDAADPALVRNNPEMFNAAQYVGHVLESLGVLSYHRILPIHLVDDLLGGYVRMSWRKLAPFVELRRRELGVYYGEWMQWLAERLAQYPSPGKLEGAHNAHKDWKP